MTGRPSRYAPPASSAAASPDATASRVDAWLAAARAREGDTSSPDVSHTAVGLSPEIAPTIPSGSRQAANRTVEVLGTIAEAIGRAQEEIAETSRAAQKAQDDTDNAVRHAFGALSDRMSAVERHVGQGGSALAQVADAVNRIEARLAEPAGFAAEGVPSHFESMLRSFETRLSDLGEKVAATPRPIGRRGLKPAAEIRNAVDEIRSHQARLDEAPAEPAASRPVLPALGTLARSQTAILSTMRADIAKLSDRVAVNAAPEAVEVLNHEVEALRDTIGGLATRADMETLEQGIRSLTAGIAELRSATPDAVSHQDMAELGAEIRRLTSEREAAQPTPSNREIEVLSHKLDIMAAGGLDPQVISALGRQVEEVRGLLANASAPQAVALVNAEIDSLRREIAEAGIRQVAPEAIATLQSTIEEVRTSVEELRGQEHAPAPDAPHATREGTDASPSVEAMLAALAEKVTAVERKMADPAALDHLERELARMADRIGTAPPSDDPRITSLEQSMAELLGEMGSWRENAIAVAEHAARAAVAEAAAAAGAAGAVAPGGSAVEQHLLAIREHCQESDRRTSESLSVVHSALESVFGRMAKLEMARERVPEVASEPRRPRISPRPGIEPELEPTAGDAPVAPQVPTDFAPAEDEILLEPGTGRPSVPPPRPVAPNPDMAEVRSSFIAAARRAAQAAQQEAAPAARRSTEATGGSLGSPRQLGQRIRRMIDERRRPLLLSAAALVLTVGSLQLARTVLLDGGPAPEPARRTAALAPAPTRAPERQTARAPGSEPTVTGTIPDRTSPASPEREPARSPAAAPLPSAPAAALTAAAPQAAPASSPAPAAPQAASTPSTSAVPPAAIASLARAAVPSAPPAAVAALPNPAVMDAQPMPPGLKGAANSGNPVALYELASRTTDGRGVARDPKAALALFEKAAEKGYAPAQYRVGNIYERGIGTTRDVEAAKSWYRRAADGGNVRAMHNLAVLIAEGGGAKPDYPAALALFTKAAGYGVRDSQFNLAVFHARGLGTAKDLSKAYLWLAVAAQSGDADSAKKRDELAASLSEADLARARAEVAAWKVTVPNLAANEVQLPAEGWPETPGPVKRASRDTRAY